MRTLITNLAIAALVTGVFIAVLAGTIGSSGL